jgi:NAD(P)-dependent dehydrogenase (short-subunit alcohol dehydrogenase family)
LADRRIVVTGAASGIGAALAGVLRDAGASVVGLDRHASDVVADLGDPDSLDVAVAAIADRGPIHGLANVAGLHPRQARGNRIVAVNLLGTRHLSERIAGRMEPGGAIVAVGSSTGWAWRERLAEHRALLDTSSYAEGLRWLEEHPVEDSVAYARSKELLAVWVRRAAVAWRERGIRVNLVVPGPVSTAAFLAFRKRMGNAPLEDVDRVGRPGTPEEVADVAAFLMGDGARWVSGVELPVDGGLAASFTVDPPGAAPV